MNNDKYICNSICENVISFLEPYYTNNQEISDFYYILSSSKNITEYILNKYNDKPWCYDRLNSDNISIKFIINNENKFKNRNKFMYYLIFHKELTEDIILNNLHLRWNWEQLLREKKISLDFVYKHSKLSLYWFNYREFIISEKLVIHIYESLNSDNYEYEYYKRLSLMINYNNVSINKIISRPDIKWDLGRIIKIPNITFNDLLLLMQHDYIFTQIHINELCVSCKDIINLINNVEQLGPFSIDYSLVSFNPYISEEYIEQNIDKDWNFMGLSRHGNLSFEFIDKYSDKSWLWIYINLEKAPIWFIDKHCNKLIGWYSIIGNTNITEDVIINNSRQWGLVTSIILEMKHLDIPYIIDKMNIDKKYYRNCKYLTFDYLYRDNIYLTNFDFEVEYDNIFKQLQDDVKDKYNIVIDEYIDLVYHPDNFNYFMIDCELMSKERLTLWGYK